MYVCRYLKRCSAKSRRLPGRTAGRVPAWFRRCPANVIVVIAIYAYYHNNIPNLL